MFRRFPFVTLMYWVLAAAVVFGIAGACSPEQYKAEADEEVYQIINSKWQDSFGHKSNYIIGDSNVPPSPNDIRIERVAPASGVIGLAQAVAIATAHNRDYQRQKEDLYLMALDLTLARHQFARKWFGTVDAGYAKDSDDEGVSSGAGLGFNRLLADQGLTVKASEDAARLLAHEGFDPDFGARPLKRTIQRLVQDPLARMVLSGEVGPGTRIQLDVEGGELVIHTSTVEAKEQTIE